MLSYDLNRFLDKVTITDDCWNWKAAKNEKGYGQFLLDRKLWIAHRLSYEWFVAPLTIGLTIEHDCENVACVNPDHLLEVTNRTNLHLRHGSTETHCKNGHERSEWTVIRHTKNAQRCVACARIARRVFIRTGSQENYMDRALPHELVL